MYVMIYNTKLSYKIHSCIVQKMSHANKRENSGASANKYFFGIYAKVRNFRGNRYDSYLCPGYFIRYTIRLGILRSENESSRMF